MGSIKATCLEALGAHFACAKGNLRRVGNKVLYHTYPEAENERIESSFQGITSILLLSRIVHIALAKINHLNERAQTLCSCEFLHACSIFSCRWAAGWEGHLPTLSTALPFVRCSDCSGHLSKSTGLLWKLVPFIPLTCIHSFDKYPLSICHAEPPSNCWEYTW